ncbi:ABC transporter permease [Bartonella sp. HY329]|uniref:ABC transporter permease n=1 Tax=unclassified Bartonella TaxID=2645622 RepID=UPI0021C81FD7|nr:MULTISPECIES: ABC transporter permease [unclassified Bartonella]UXM95204.1 ABC transporter permease [Bartonella sp. HY329]UXN09527.1 ABC transporter permease [Bartonella sp. HY328]
MLRATWFNYLSLILGFSFIYLPIVVLVVYSFNASSLISIWGGFSTKWYGEVFNNDSLLSGAKISFIVAGCSATGATFLGTLSAIILNRFKRFRGRSLFNAMLLSPMIMPEVVLGISMLLMFVALGISRGPLTIIIAHITFTMCFAFVVIQSRLSELDPSLEEAARDLGCTPFSAFIKVALPNLTTALISAWLLSFTLSLDDLVIANFTSGPGASTLPMNIYSQIKFGVTPEINAISTIILGIVTSGLIIARLLTRNSKSAAAAATI